MLRFMSGFLAASVLWGALAFLHYEGRFGAHEPEPSAAPAALADAAATDEPDRRKGDKRKRKRVRRPGEAASGDSADQQVGDDLGWDDARNVDMAAGEEQLSGSEIEAGFDSAMGKIRRCLILVPADGEIRGKLIFGMRVGSDGRPRAVNLTGPSIVTGGESGDCLRDAAKAIRFATFDGPDMLFNYPVTLQ